MNDFIIAIRAHALFVSIVFIAAAKLLTPTSYAAPIVWQTPNGVNISSTGDVATAGGLVAAYRFGATGITGVTVNTVTFSPFAIPHDYGTGATTVGNFNLNISNFRVAGNTFFGSANAPFTTLSPEYQALLRSGAASAGGVMTLTIAGLVSGQGYLFEWWCNDAGLALGGTTQTPTATATNSVTAIDNLANANGSLGQYVIGNFTADSSGLESITFTGAPVMNAFQLRTVAPEPSSSVMMFGSIGILAAFRRFRL